MKGFTHPSQRGFIAAIIGLSIFCMAPSGIVQVVPPIMIKAIESTIPVETGAQREASLENELMYVHFIVKLEDAPGFVELVIDPQSSAAIPGGYQWRVPARTQTVSLVGGVIHAYAPRAGADHSVQVTYKKEKPCEGPGETFVLCGDAIGTASLAFDTASMISFGLSRFHIEHPRKKILWTMVIPLPIFTGTDDVWASLGARRPGGETIVEPPLAVHIGLATKGDTRGFSGEGPRSRVEALRTPLLVVLPSDSPRLSVAYALANNPNVGETSESFFNSLSGATAGVLNVVYGSSSGGSDDWNKVDQFTQQLNNWLFDDCDGYTAADAIAFTGREMINLTRDGRHEETRKYTGEDYKADALGCGVGASEYDVTWDLIRHSETQGASGQALEPVNPVQQIRLAQGREVSLGIRTPVHDIEWEVEGGPAHGTVRDDGTFVAASNLAAGELVAITAREVPAEHRAARTGKFYVGLLP